MCGIFCYIGPRNAVRLVLEGIQKLEYRGYDSSGIALVSEGKLIFVKKMGKVAVLQAAIENQLSQQHLVAHTAVAHTRWATHGKPSDTNAHPHSDRKELCAVVHNGIIENHEAVRHLLEKRGIIFRSETDTEVISQLIGYLYKGNFLKAVQRGLALLQGAFALAVVHQNHPHEVICAAKESPLAIGIGEGEMFIASDPYAFVNHTKRAIYLHSSEIAVVTKNSVRAFNSRLLPIQKESEDLKLDVQEAIKGKYPHYMLKEIFEQPQTIQNALLSRYSEEYGTAILEGAHFSDEDLLKIQRIIILGCGTSYHAGMLGAYMLQEKARIPVEVEISSEFRYKNPIVVENTLAIAISQSGETADTLAALKELKAKGAKILGICNVQGSSIAREVDSSLFLRAGPEIGVASTKAFTSQVIILALLTLKLARMRLMGQNEGKQYIECLKRLPSQVKEVLEQADYIQSLAKKYAHYEDFFFLGRRLMYPTALEAALKLTEIAYVNAKGYPAGEMKHGPIALINESCPTLAFCADAVTYQKILSNMMEIKARGGKILAVVPEGATDIKKVADDIFWVPKTIDELSPICSTLFGQLFAYYVALERGTEIDQPRNLAKSVTVE